MVANGEMRQAELAGNFFIGQPVEQMVQNFALAVGQHSGSDGGGIARLRYAAWRQVGDFRAGQGGLNPRHGIGGAVMQYGDQQYGATRAIEPDYTGIGIKI